MRGGTGEWQERSLASIFASSWKRVLQKARRAVVHLDGPMAECAQWNGGLSQLFAAGATAVQSFVADAPVHPGAKKALFILRGPLIGPSRDTLRLLIASGNYEYCVVFTAASAALHRFLKSRGGSGPGTGPAGSGSCVDLNADVLEEMEIGILQWTNNPNSTVEMMTNPLVAGFRVLDDVALLPTCAGLGLSGDGARVLSRHVASSLAHLCASLCPTQPEVFHTPGPNSERLAKEFIAAAAEEALWPSAADKKKGGSHHHHQHHQQHQGRAFELPEKKASLILFDRASDLVAPCGHWKHSVADLAFSSPDFPHLPGHSSDLAVSLPSFGDGDYTSETLFPGSLSDVLVDHPELVSSMFLQPADECVRRVVDEARRASTSTHGDDDEHGDWDGDDDFHDAIDDGDEPGNGGVRRLSVAGSDCSTTATTTALGSCVRRLTRSTKSAMEHAGVLQASLLASVAEPSKLKGEVVPKSALLASLEASMLEMASAANDDGRSDDEEGDDFNEIPLSERFLSEVEKALNDRRANGLTLDDVLGLLAFSASLFGPSILPVFNAGNGGGNRDRDDGNASSSPDGSRDGSPCDVAEIEPLLMDALWEDRDELPPVCAKIVGPSVNEMSVRTAGRKIAAKLAWLASQRTKWTQNFRDLTHCPDPRFPAEYVPLVTRLMAAVLKPGKAEVPSVIHRPAEEEGLRDLLKTGLGFLMKSKKACHPADADTIVLAVLGGVSPSEVRRLRELVDKEPDKRIIVCATRLLKPEDTVEDLFVA